MQTPETTPTPDQARTVVHIADAGTPEQAAIHIEDAQRAVSPPMEEMSPKRALNYSRGQNPAFIPVDELAYIDEPGNTTTVGQAQEAMLKASEEIRTRMATPVNDPARQLEELSLGSISTVPGSDLETGASPVVTEAKSKDIVIHEEIVDEAGVRRLHDMLLASAKGQKGPSKVSASNFLTTPWARPVMPKPRGYKY